MAMKFFHHKLTVTPSANPQSLWQLRVGTNHRVLLHAIEIMPKGNTPASAPLNFVLVLQNSTGTYDTDDSANLIKEIPAYSGNIVSTMHITCSVEPGSNTIYYPISVHQQARLRWTPPTKSGVAILDTATRWALRSLFTSAPELDIVSIFEE